MTAEELWEKFIQSHNIEVSEYDAWAFGDDADLLADLVVRGEKTATASAYVLYELEGEPLPKAEEYSVVLDSKENAVCIIQTKKVSVVPFSSVTAEHAYKEGEGDKSLSYWREVHEQFFREELEKVGLEFTPELLVVCEEFDLVYKG